MVADPPMFAGDASAQEAGEALSRPEVRAVFVSDDGGRLLGVVTRKTLVREVVAAGRDPRGTKLREIAEVPLNTIGSDLPLDEAFRFLEEQDLDRVPVLAIDLRCLRQNLVGRELARRGLEQSLLRGEVAMALGNFAKNPRLDERAPGQHRVEVQLLSFGRGVEAIGIHVKKLSLGAIPIYIHDDKRRAGNRIH